MSGVFLHPWLSGLFGDPEIADILSADAELSRMIAIEAAWTRTMGSATGHDPARIERVAAHIESCGLKPDDIALGTARDGLPVPDLAKRLKEGLSPEDRDLVHRGLTSQDVMDTSLMLAMGAVMDVLRPRVDTVADHLLRLSETQGNRHLMGHTRMQPALPVTVADRIDTWRRPLLSLSTEIAGLRRDSAILQWGGPVGVRDPELLGELGVAFAAALGLGDPGHAWHSDRTPVARIAETLSRLTGSLGKMGQDIALMAQAGPDALTMSAGGGSSAMPHKQNPVAAELLVTLARYSAGQLALVHGAMIHEQERSGAAWTLEWMTLPGMAQAAGRALTAAAEMLGRIESLGTVQRPCDPS